MKEAYVKPTVKSEILKADVLCTWGSPGNGGDPPRRGFFFWKNLD
jgi:hypothetical protein